MCVWIYLYIHICICSYKFFRDLAPTGTPTPPPILHPLSISLPSIFTTCVMQCAVEYCNS